MSELLQTKFSIFALFLELLGAQNKKERNRELEKRAQKKYYYNYYHIKLVYSTIVAVYGKM